MTIEVNVRDIVRIEIARNGILEQVVVKTGIQIVEDPFVWDVDFAGETTEEGLG